MKSKAKANAKAKAKAKAMAEAEAKVEAKAKAKAEAEAKDQDQGQTQVIDIVIAASWTGDENVITETHIDDSEHADGFPRIARDRNNGELEFTLRSIAKQAPWMNHIYILVNGKHALPKWIPEPEKTTVVDRCTLLPKGTCPTRNGFVAMSVVHKVPGLSEKFIYTDDDNLLVTPHHSMTIA